VLPDTVRILNFDESILRQKKLIGRFSPHVVDLTKLASRARFWLSRDTAQEIQNVLDPKLKNAITFLGSGDFHQISSLLIHQFQEPISVIVLDCHPDWDIRPPKSHCGSWVNEILKNPHVEKVILLGVSSKDISTFHIVWGNLGAFQNDRLEIYPYSRRSSSVVLRKVPKSRSVKIQKKIFHTEMNWQELKGQNFQEFIARIKLRLPTKKVYVSLDKDCLRSAHALTNWEEGCFELDELLFLIRLILENFDVVGMDITGDYSAFTGKNGFKAFCGWLDCPTNFSAKEALQPTIDSVNETTNIAILETILSRQRSTLC